MKKNYILTLLSLVVLLLAACTGNNPGTNDNTNDSGNDIVQNDSDNNTGNGDGETNQDDSNSDENSGSTQNEENLSSMEGAMTPVEAYERYVEEYPNTKVGKVHLDKSKNMYVYKIEGFDEESEYELKIDPLNGEILESKSERDDDTHTEIPKNLLNDVEELVDGAIKEVGEDAFLDEWEVDHEDGKFILEVEIDRKSGENLSYKYDLETKELLGIDS